MFAAWVRDVFGEADGGTRFRTGGAGIRTQFRAGGAGIRTWFRTGGVGIRTWFRGGGATAVAAKLFGEEGPVQTEWISTVSHTDISDIECDT